MARGQKTPADVVAEFRRHYLETGNVSESARRVGLSPKTGDGLAAAADDDPAFRKVREAYLAQEVEQLRAMVKRGAAILAAGLEQGPLLDAAGAPIDRRAEIQRAIVASYDALDRTRARHEARMKPAETAEAQITIKVNLKATEESANAASDAQPPGGEAR